MSKSHLLIALKNGGFIETNGFKEVKYRTSNGTNSISAEKFDTFSLSSTRSYTFVGDSIVSLLGNEILYILVE